MLSSFVQFLSWGILTIFSNNTMFLSNSQFDSQLFLCSRLGWPSVQIRHFPITIPRASPLNHPFRTKLRNSDIPCASNSSLLVSSSTIVFILRFIPLTMFRWRVWITIPGLKAPISISWTCNSVRLFHYYLNIMLLPIHPFDHSLFRILCRGTSATLHRIPGSTARRWDEWCLWPETAHQLHRNRPAEHGAPQLFREISVPSEFLTRQSRKPSPVSAPHI